MLPSWTSPVVTGWALMAFSPSAAGIESLEDIMVYVDLGPPLQEDQADSTLLEGKGEVEGEERKGERGMRVGRVQAL